jgi:hypothetical protein
MASLAEVKSRIKKFASNRALLNDLKETIVPKMQRELIPLIVEADPDDKGIVITNDDGEEVAAHVQQSSASSYWNQEQIVEYLKKHPKLWKACSSEVFDPKKWEAEIANGNISKATAETFKEKGTTPSPFIRFGKPGKDSLR